MNMNMTAGQKSLQARKARIAARLLERFRVNSEQAHLAAEILIGKNITAAQAGAHNPSVRTVAVVNRAIDMARKMTCDGCKLGLPNEFPYLGHHTH